MNPLDNLDPRAKAFWEMVIRHALSGIGGVLIAHGWVSQSAASGYTELLVGAGLYALANIWAHRSQYWEQVKQAVALLMPEGSTEAQVVAKVAELKAANVVQPPAVLLPRSEGTAPSTLLDTVDAALVTHRRAVLTGATPSALPDADHAAMVGRVNEALRQFQGEPKP